MTPVTSGRSSNHPLRVTEATRPSYRPRSMPSLIRSTIYSTSLIIQTNLGLRPLRISSRVFQRMIISARRPGATLPRRSLPHREFRQTHRPLKNLRCNSTACSEECLRDPLAGPRSFKTRASVRGQRLQAPLLPQRRARTVTKPFPPSKSRAQGGCRSGGRRRVRS